MKIHTMFARLRSRRRLLDDLIRTCLETDAKLGAAHRHLLEAHRQTRDLAVAFRLAVERPEVDLRADLDTLIRDLDDHIAQAEEWIADAAS